MGSGGMRRRSRRRLAQAAAFDKRPPSFDIPRSGLYSMRVYDMSTRRSPAVMRPLITRRAPSNSTSACPHPVTTSVRRPIVASMRAASKPASSPRAESEENLSVARPSAAYALTNRTWRGVSAA